jgi:hypothetical protein
MTLFGLPAHRYSRVEHRCNEVAVRKVTSLVSLPAFVMEKDLSEPSTTAGEFLTKLGVLCRTAGVQTQDEDLLLQMFY